MIPQFRAGLIDVRNGKGHMITALNERPSPIEY